MTESYVVFDTFIVRGIQSTNLPNLVTLYISTLVKAQSIMIFFNKIFKHKIYK